MAGFFIFSIACLCLAGAFLLAVLAYIAIKDMKQDEEKNPTVTLYDGIYEEEVFKLDSIQTICVQDGLPNDANFNLWKPKKIWHKPSEEPNEYKKVFYEWNTDVAIGHNVGFYHKDTKDFSKDHKHQRYMSEVAKWAYVEDIVAF